MQPATVAAWPSGDSGWAWSRTAAASAVSPSAMASAGEPHGDRGEFAGVPGRGEHGHVAPFDSAAECLLQRVRVGHVDVAGIDAFLGQQRCELAQQLIGHAGLDLDVRQPGRRRFGSAASHVWHAGHLPRSAACVSRAASRSQAQPRGGGVPG